MISSKFIYDILNLMLDDETLDESLSRQITFLTDIETVYTDVGVFINFKNEIEEEFLKIGMNLTFDGVEIQKDELNILADAIIQVKDGIICQLEIFNKNGLSFPKEEIKSFVLNQNWKDSKKRTITKN